MSDEIEEKLNMMQESIDNLTATVRDLERELANETRERERVVGNVEDDVRDCKNEISKLERA